MSYSTLTRIAGSVADRLAPLGGADWRQRLGLVTPAVPGGVWLHGASVGEIASVRALIAALSAEMPVTVTANTPTGRARADVTGVAAALAPLDTPQALGRFLDAVRELVARRDELLEPDEEQLAT